MGTRHSAASALRKIASRIDERPAPAVAAPGRRPRAGSISARGSRKASMFFDDYPRFFETSETSAFHNRLNLRYEAIFAENRDILAGARVLDIASHDGRWSLAALACGAKSVVGIEARQDLVDHAGANLELYGYGSDQYAFVVGDVCDVLNEQDFDFDVVLCLGYLYHTLRYNALMHGIRKANPGHVIIDTVARPMRVGRPAVWLVREPISREGNAFVDKFSFGDSVIVGQPSLRAIRMLLGGYGFEVDRFSDWDGLIRDNPELAGEGLVDYAKRQRLTIRCIDTT